VVSLYNCAVAVQCTHTQFGRTMSHANNPGRDSPPTHPQLFSISSSSRKERKEEKKTPLKNLLSHFITCDVTLSLPVHVAPLTVINTKTVCALTVSHRRKHEQDNKEKDWKFVYVTCTQYRCTHKHCHNNT
jgi:hypothetical protein